MTQEYLAYIKDVDAFLEQVQLDIEADCKELGISKEDLSTTTFKYTQ